MCDGASSRFRFVALATDVPARMVVKAHPGLPGRNDQARRERARMRPPPVRLGRGVGTPAGSGNVLVPPINGSKSAHSSTDSSANDATFAGSNSPQMTVFSVNSNGMLHLCVYFHFSPEAATASVPALTDDSHGTAISQSAPMRRDDICIHVPRRTGRSSKRSSRTATARARPCGGRRSCWRRPTVSARTRS